MVSQEGKNKPNQTNWIVSTDCVSYCTTESEWTSFSKTMHCKCFTKEVFLKIPQNSHENTLDL